MVDASYCMATILAFVAISELAVPGMVMISILFRALFPLGIVHQPPTALLPWRIHPTLRRRPAHPLRQPSPSSPL